MIRGDDEFQARTAGVVLIIGLTLAAGLFTPARGQGQSAAKPPIVIEDPALNARYQRILREVRCLVCGSQSIAESPSDVAGDLRQLIYSMLVAGASDAEIATFLTERFGDSVLYRPPWQANTWLLWTGPFLFLAAGTAVFAIILRQRVSAPIPPPADDPRPVDCDTG